MKNAKDRVAVAALYVDPAGPYPSMLDVDCWDAERDARTYDGEHPVVLHPPCGRWCQLAPLNERRWGAKVGDDGGLFAHALSTLLRCGGVLEHPAFSIAWRPEWFDLPRPGKGGWSRHDTDRGELWVCEVWQSSYGHPARKRTWLLYRGGRPPLELDWRRDQSLATHQIGCGVHTGKRSSKPRLKNSQTHLSPPAFAEALVALARWSAGVDVTGAERPE